MNRLNGIDGANQEEWDKIEKVFKAEISDNIKREIKKKYTRQKDFARIIGIAEPTIFKWTNGKVAPDLFYIYKICKILEISFEDILGSFFVDNKNKKEKTNAKKINYNLSDDEIVKLKHLVQKM